MNIKNYRDYEIAYQKSIDNPDLFWAEIAEHFHWRKKWNKVLEWDFEKPDIKWFLGAKLNITENCIDRHLENNAEKPALIWEPNDSGEKHKIYSYKDLHSEVCRFANVLKKLGVEKGDRVCIYMPMIPELAFALLACARIGAVHSVVFAGFSANSLSDRINDAAAKLVICSDAMSRGAKQLAIKNTVDEAIKSCTSVEKVLVVNRLDWPIQIKPNFDYIYDVESKGISDHCPATEMDAEDMLFILYTSGSTGKPKGVVHTTAGYMVYAAYSFKNVFQCDNKDIHFCTADIGWITGHSYILYGPLLNAATTVMFEGVPNYPDASRFWQIIEKHSITHFYTAPTAIRSLMQSGSDYVIPYAMHSLKVLGTVGEPINEEAWLWYHVNVGKERCQIVDTWFQTETGGILISALAGISPLCPAHAGQPLPGIQPVLLDNNGNEIVENEKEGYLCIKFPWPSMLRTTYGDHERCRQTYFSSYKGYYFTGDGAKRDKNGLYRIIGRVDDVINVSGHRFGTAEIENAVNQNKNVIESAVVGYPHDLKGQGIYVYVICKELPIGEEQNWLRSSIIQTVSEEIGPIAKPDKIQFVSALPKTRSGKIMRRILRKVAEGDTSNLGDITTLLDPMVVEEIILGAI
jgi:acetyl-CoA synthetase